MLSKLILMSCHLDSDFVSLGFLLEINCLTNLSGLSTNVTCQYYNERALCILNNHMQSDVNCHDVHHAVMSLCINHTKRMSLVSDLNFCDSSMTVLVVGWCYFK